MSGIQTNFRAEDMLGSAQAEVVVKPAPVLKGTKAAKPAPAPVVVEETVAVVEESVEVVEESTVVED